MAGLIFLAYAVFSLSEDSASTKAFLAAEMASVTVTTCDMLEACQLKHLVNWGSSQILTDLDCSQKYYSKNSLH